MKLLLEQIRECTQCAKHLPLGPRPMIFAAKDSRIIVIGQAPGRVVHETGLSWNDKSGDNLRTWLGVDRNTFYDPANFALMPMAFCYPGTGKSGDHPPRPECAPLWHDKLRLKMKHAKLTLLIGHYAQEYYLRSRVQKNLTETVRHFHAYLPDFFPLPHPSPRNNLWQAKNRWFIDKVIPELRRRTHSILDQT